MLAILSVIPMIQSALSVIGAFQGTPKIAKATGYIQDAIATVSALVPLVQSFADGNDVTEDDVRAALTGMHKALADFDKLIAEKQ